MRPSPRPRPEAARPASTSSAIRGPDLGEVEAGSSRAGRARRRRRAPRAAIRTSSRWASSGAGVGVASTFGREHPLGEVVEALEAAAAGPRSTWPDQNSHSSARLASDQPHHGPRAAGPCWASSEAAIGPRSRTSVEHARDQLRPLRGWTAPHAAPGVARRPRSMRQRNSGCRARPAAATPRAPSTRRAAGAPDGRGASSVGRAGTARAAAEGRQVVRSLQHVDRVDLDRGRHRRGRGGCPSRPTRPGRPRLGEALRGERQPPGLAGAESHSCSPSAGTYAV